jgi:ABC-type long-subunit fatty acid transport system fused permease/ATPase subunit
MLKEFFLPTGHGWVRDRLWAWSGLIVFFGHQVFRAYIAWAMNAWYERFYDMMQTSAEVVEMAAMGNWTGGMGFSADNPPTLAIMRNRVQDSLIEFLVIVAPAVAVHPLAGLWRNWWVFTWRRTLMRSYLERWNPLVPPVEGASQRVHEDTQRFASGIQNCVSVILQSIFTLGVFCPVLYNMDPVLMTFAASAAVGGLGVSMLVGWPLVGLEVKNQVVEAELRKKLVLMETDSTSVSAISTTGTGFDALFGQLTSNYGRLYLSFAALGTWLALYEQGVVMLPYSLAAPRLFAEDPAHRLTLGQLVKIANAFGKVFDALNVVSDRWLEINEWRSCLRRLSEFERQMSRRQRGTSSRLANEASGPPGELSASTVSVVGAMAVDTEMVVVEEDSSLPWIARGRQNAERHID